MSDIPIDVPGEYARGLLNRLGDRDWLDSLASTPAALREAVEGLDDATLRRAEAPGKWSMIEVVQHLADAETVVAFRVRTIVADDTPPVTAYDQEKWADRLRYREASLEEALEQFTALRDANVRLVRRL